ncbi:MAG: ATP-binding protein, partial [Methanomassiliicoccaceae archaeon]|nr:ATP-binding protein [Methanomassiliicoccaceae archaeon]
MYSSGKFEFMAVYGRRRVGKTALLEEFAKDKEHIFIKANRTKGGKNIRLFREAVKRSFGTETADMDLDELLKVVGENSERRLTLIIDEFPYFVESNDELLSSLQIFIDHK